MRKVVASLFISLDGVTEAPDQWQFDFDAEMAADMAHRSPPKTPSSSGA